MPQSRPFVHLHCHSHYSLLDGASSIPRLIERTVEHGMNALALTDHGNLHGALEFYQAARRKGINPIIGYEAYVAPGSRLEKGNGPGEKSYHLTLLCQNATGFRNLVKMASSAALEGFYFKPRIDLELLEAHSEGIICLSGCVSSQFNQAILRNQGRGAEEVLKCAAEVAGWFHRVFGDRYYIEIMNNGVGIQQVCLEASVELAQQQGIPLVATSDCHYVDPDDSEAQDVMLCINTGRFRTDANRMKMDGKEYFLRSPGQMYEKFPGLEDAVARSQEIADSVDIRLEIGARHFPVYHLPDERPPALLLRDICEEGLRERYAGNEELLPGGAFSEELRQRLDRELSVIEKLGFENYFLIVWDFVREARARNIPATARGSGVGALVCFALYLSHVCPIRYDLLFERFLDENRLEAPDIDIDFCKERRGEMIDYVKEKYGAEMVAQIGTFGTLAARAAIKDVGRVLGMPLTRVNQITAMVPDRPKIKIKDALAENEELRKVYDKDPEVRELIDFARMLEGLARNIGTHAAAVVIGDKPLTEYLPLGRVSGKDDIITQWSMEDVEAAGLLKMDFLGLRNLTVLSSAIEIIEQTRGEKLDLQRIPLDDGETFAMLQRGETKGVFQLESGGIRDLLQKMKPDHFRDIIATAALYRPGPLEGGMVQQYIDVKHGRKPAVYKHKVLEEVLGETHGVMVYQEQVMRILNRLGNIPLAEAYTCIKAIGKKKEAVIAASHEQFIAGAVANGLPRKTADEFWEMILKFAGYGFNKSHSTAYALIAWQTAWLKTHYPCEYMAALLTGDIPHRNFTRKDSLVEHMEDCQRMGIEVVAPSINSSGVRFTVADGTIHFALSAIKGCGGAAAEAIVASRDRNGPFRDIFDFCERVESSLCNRSSMETLIKAGAMDCFGARRSQLLAALDRALQSGAAAAADRRSGQKSLFADNEDAAPVDTLVALPDIPDLDRSEQLHAEKEVLGFYLTSHPLQEVDGKLTGFRTHLTSQLNECRDREAVAVGGMISSIKFSHVKRVRDPGSPTKYVMFDLEDMAGSVRCILWPTDFVTHGHVVQPDAVLIARGVVDKRGGDEVNLVVNELIPLESLDERYTTGLRLHISEEDSRPGILDTVYQIVRGYPGTRKLELALKTLDGSLVHLISHKLQVDVNPEMRSRLTELLGNNAVQWVTEVPRPVGEESGKDRRRRFAET
jgi:DNA polymerase-3 subunit alpha